LPAPYAARIQSLRRLIDDIDAEVELFTRPSRGRLVADPGYLAVQQLPGVGPVLAAVFVAEIGEVSRFARPRRSLAGAGLTPKHRESDAHVHRGRITKQGSRLVRWAAVESVKTLSERTVVGAYKKQVAQRRGKNVGTVAAARKQTEFVSYALRDHHVRAVHRTVQAAAPA
jgi:transposase